VNRAMRWFALLMVACGDDDVAFPLPPSCNLDTDCLTGHACMASVCDSRCDDLLCQSQIGERAECWGGASGTCRTVECGRIVPCEDAELVCDRTSFGCFPESGRCDVSADCPLMFGAAKDLGLICEDQTCRFPSPPLSRPVEAPGGLSVARPSPGAELATSESLEIEVPGLAGVYFFVITTSESRSLRQIGTAAVWQAVIRNPSVVRWADGYNPRGSAGSTLSPGLPEGTPLYMIVFRYERGRLRESSQYVPFTVGKGWKGPGDDCEDPQSIPGACWHPLRLQGCSPAGSCEVVCASHRDCTGWMPDSVCRVPNDRGIRFCSR
jgi:hypothetical protein